MNKQKISQLIKDALKFSKEDNFLKSIELYKQVLLLDTTNIEALINISDCYIKLNLSSNAEKYAAKAYQLYPDEDMSTVNYSCILIDSKQFKKAIEILEIRKENNSDDYLVYNNLGYAYFLNNDFEKAIENYNISIDLEEINPLAYCNRGILKHKIFQDAAGIDDLKKADKYGDIEASMILLNNEKNNLHLS